MFYVLLRGVVFIFGAMSSCDSSYSYLCMILCHGIWCVLCGGSQQIHFTNRVRVEVVSIMCRIYLTRNISIWLLSQARTYRWRADPFPSYTFFVILQKSTLSSGYVNEGGDDKASAQIRGTVNFF